MKHGKYSKDKEVKPYQLVIITKRWDGEHKDYWYFKTQEEAEMMMETFKVNEPEPNQYYFGCEYQVNYIGTNKLIKGVK